MTAAQLPPRIVAISHGVPHSLAARPGQSVLARVRVATAAGALVRPGPAVSVRVLAWAPGTSQASAPDVIAEAAFDGRDWCAVISTEGWAPGSWRIQAQAECPAGQDRPGLARGADAAVVAIGGLHDS